MAFRRWIWVRDTKTGHHLDVDARQLDRLVRAKAVEPVPNYPVNEGQNAQPRPAKHNVNLGERVSDDQTASAAETPPGEAAGTTPSASASTRRTSTRTATTAKPADPTSAEGVDQ